MPALKRTARLYQPPKTAMQQGRAKTTQWVLDITPLDKLAPNPLMGWASGEDTTRQLKLSFDSREEALAYAVKESLSVEEIPPSAKKVQPKSYADNFT